MVKYPLQINHEFMADVFSHVGWCTMVDKSDMELLSSTERSSKICVTCDHHCCWWIGTVRCIDISNRIDGEIRHLMYCIIFCNYDDVIFLQLHSLFWPISEKTFTQRITGIYEGNPRTIDGPHHKTSLAGPCDDWSRYIARRDTMGSQYCITLPNEQR